MGDRMTKFVEEKCTHCGCSPVRRKRKNPASKSKAVWVGQYYRCPHCCVTYRR